MNYLASELILEEIRKANKILINCHTGPDPDSFGSATSMYQVLRKMGKEVRILCSTEFQKDLNYLEGFDKIEYVDLTKIDFTKYDLFITLDSSSWDFATGMGKNMPKIPIIAIDHHKTNEKYGIINLVDSSRSSCCEVLFLLFEDFKVKFDKKLATSLLTGLIGDTGAFRFPAATHSTFEIAGKLMKLGADKNEIILRTFFSLDFKLLKYWGKVMETMKFEKDGEFIWSAMSAEDFKKYEGKDNYPSMAATYFLQTVKDSKIGLLMTEQKKGTLDVSLRSRTGLDVSKIATELKGGGHQYAAGGKVEGLPFKEAVDKVLEVARKYTRN